MTQTMDFLAPLDDLAVLRIEGDDAIDFLHAQLSNDISGMGPEQARLAAYCTPKGRMLGNLLLWRESPESGSALLALVKADLLEPLLKRLRMFVLRAKVSFHVSALKAYGLSLSSQGGAGTEGELNWAAGQAWQVRHLKNHTLISAPDIQGGPTRCWLVAGQDQNPDTLAAELGVAIQPATDWQAQEIEAGLGWVEQGNLELFIPQSLNYDLNGGVNFTKGCYPGQEVVARAHYRGAVKRRGLPGRCTLPAGATLQAGMDIFDAAKAGTAAGRIINAVAHGAPADGGQVWTLFMEINLNDVGQLDFRALAADGPAVTLLPLPYALDAAQ